MGNKGGARKSAYAERQDAIWHEEKWKLETDVPVLQAKLRTGKYSVRDVFLAKALQGNEKILGIFANKLLADRHDVTTLGEAIPASVAMTTAQAAILAKYEEDLRSSLQEETPNETGTS